MRAILETRLESGKPPLRFPLLRCLGSEGFSVTIESFWHALATLAKSGLAHSLAPGRKLYSKAVPHDLHAIGVSKIAGLDGADIFVRQVDALDAFIVGGGRHLHTGSA